MIIICCTLVQNDDISRFLFHFFKTLIFGVFQLSKRAKNGLKWEKVISVTLHIPGTMHHMTFIYAFMVQIIISPGFFFFFLILSKFWFSRFFWGRVKRAKNSPQKTLSVAPYIYGTIHHMIVICGNKCKLVICPGTFFKNLIFQ